MQIQQTILVFGEVLFDAFPEVRRPGGAPLNVACHLGAFGCDPLLVTRTGADPEREEILELLARYRLDASGVQEDAAYPTGRVLVEPEGEEHHFHILPDQAYDHIDSGAAVAAVLGRAIALVYFGTLAQRSDRSREALDAIVRQASAPRFLDVNLRRPWYDAAVVAESLRRADIVKMNGEELEELGRLLGIPARDAPGITRALIRDFELRELVVTRGAAGARWTGADGAEFEVRPPAVPPRMVDAVGCGDGFSAVFMLGRLRGWPPQATLDRADRFARALCGIRGAIPRDRSFYAPWRAEWDLGDRAG